jgi:hypothetical protein
MCRCNAFVDFDLAEFAAFTKARVASILPGPVPVPPSPAPPATPAPKLPKAATPRKVRTPKVAVPKAADLIPKPVPTVTAGQPTGTPVSSRIRVEAGYQKVVAALAEIDKVHGDGPLPIIPAGAVERRFARKALAYYMHDAYSGTAVALGFGRKILKASPHIGVFHEVGHFLDHKGVTGGGRLFATADRTMISDLPTRKAFDDLMTAIKQSESIQTLAKWHQAHLPGTGLSPGDGIVPKGVHRGMVSYLLKSNEAFARAYAQYIATKSTNPAVKNELRRFQAQAAVATKPVPATMRYNGKSFGESDADTWEYPWQWTDTDFKPIEAAFDTLMDRLGWRKQ